MQTKEKFRSLRIPVAIIVGLVLVVSALWPILYNYDFCWEVKHSKLVGCRAGCETLWGPDDDNGFGVIECTGEPFYEHLASCEIIDGWIEEVCLFGGLPG